MRSLVRFHTALALVALIVAALLPSQALAGKADVIGVKIAKERSGTYKFTVTIRSDDTGWKKYADRWEVLAPNGRVLGVRELLHPHEDEQPFTRDLSGVRIPNDITEVRVRARDKIEGWGGKVVTVAIPR
jgi:hypothetical protein